MLLRGGTDVLWEIQLFQGGDADVLKEIQILVLHHKTVDVGSPADAVERSARDPHGNDPLFIFTLRTTLLTDRCKERQADRETGRQMLKRKTIYLQTD